MAVSQQFLWSPGRKLTARLAQPVEPGNPRLYWDGAAGQFTSDPSARVVVQEDPTIPGLYLVEIPSTSTRTWPGKVYWLAILDTEDGTLVDVFRVPISGGDDGTAEGPSVDLPWADGSLIHFNGAYRKPRV